MKKLTLALSLLLLSTPLQAQSKPIQLQGNVPTCVPTAVYNAINHSEAYEVEDYELILDSFNTSIDGTQMSEITDYFHSKDMSFYTTFLGVDPEYLNYELQEHYIIVAIDLTNIAQYDFEGNPYHCVVISELENGYVETLDSNSIEPIYYNIDDFLGAISSEAYIIRK